MHEVTCQHCGYGDYEEHQLQYKDITIYTHTEYCENCDYEVTLVSHKFTNGKCDCGAKPAVEIVSLTFGATVGASDKSVNGYTSTWTATRNGYTWKISNFNNNQLYKGNWTYIRAGSKKDASIASITSPKFTETITSIVITLDSITTKYVKAFYLEVSASENFATIIQKSDISTNTSENNIVTIESPKPDLYYRIVVDCDVGTDNGFVQISKVTYKGFD